MMMCMCLCTVHVYLYMCVSVCMGIYFYVDICMLCKLRTEKKCTHRGVGPLALWG